MISLSSGLILRKTEKIMQMDWRITEENPPFFHMFLSSSFCHKDNFSQILQFLYSQFASTL